MWAELSFAHNRFRLIDPDGVIARECVMPLGWRLARREMFGRKDQFECEEESTSSSFVVG